MLSRLATAFLATVLALGMFSPLAIGHAEGPGVISGRVVSKTAGASPVAGGEAFLVVHRVSTNADDVRRASLAEGGSFRFEGLATDADYQYAVTYLYSGLDYSTDPLQFQASQTELRADVSVWETTDRNPGVTVDQAAIFVMGADEESQSLRIVEFLTLHVPGDRTFVPRPDGPDGPIGLVRFGLPRGAADVVPAIGLDPTQIIEVDRGFASMAPLPPGPRQVGYAYRLDYDRARFSFGMSLAMGARDFRVLVGTGGPKLGSPSLGRAADTQIGSQTYQVLVGRDLPAGSQVTVELDGLPARAVWEAPPGQVPAVPILGLGAVAAGALVFLTVRRSRLGGIVGQSPALTSGRSPAGRERGGERSERNEGLPASSLANEVMVDDREALLAALAALDDRYEQGLVEAGVYEQQRTALKQRLVDLMRDRPAREGTT